MADVEVCAACYRDRLLVAGETESPVRVLHPHVSLADMSPGQHDAFEQFTTALLR